MTYQQALKEIFGFTDLKPGQQAVMEKIATGESAAAIFPTGAGKSLCYQLPALHEPGMTLVISPLLSLMKDQIEFLQKKNVRAAKLDSKMTAEDYRNTIKLARKGNLMILMIAVERFNNERFRNQLRQMPVSLLVVDEAHCISEWGHNFRPDYLKIPIFQKEFNIPKVLLLTATATPQVAADMCDKFSISQSNIIRTGFYRKNLFLRILPVAEEKKTDALHSVLAGDPAGPAIVYVTLQKTAERIAALLKEKGFDAAAYHAGMPNDQRESVQKRFMNSTNGVIVATIAFGMGIDKSNIRKVVHFDLPKSMESYSQEIGRAGRDGKPSLCCVMANRNGIPVLENFIYGDTPYREGIKKVLDTIRQSPARNLEIRLYTLSQDTDIRPLPLKTLLVYLEIQHIISPKYTFFEQYPFKYLISENEIANQFQGERNTFVKTLLSHAKTAKTWTYPDIDAAVSASGSDRKRVLAALDYFHEQGWIDLRPKSRVGVYEILKPDFDMENTTETLFELFKEKESRDIDRIYDMISLFEKNQCIAKSLSAYFGEQISGDCGRCSTCLNNHPAKLPSSDLPPVDTHDYELLLKPLKEASGTDIPLHLATRFLCGIATPRLIRLKAKTMPGFGSLAKYPYRIVKEWIIQNTGQIKKET